MIRRALLSEALGSLILFATVIGSGIMDERLASGNEAIALICNTLATAAILFVLITMLGPVSGAHLNPAVTLIMHLRGHVSTGLVCGYVIAQVAGGVLGVWLTHLMFDEQVFQLSHKVRAGPGQWAGEAVATFGPILTILGTSKVRPEHIPASVARSMSDSFAGIAPWRVPALLVAQLAGAIAAHVISKPLFPERQGLAT